MKELKDYKPEEFGANRDDINSLIMEQASDAASEKLTAAHPDTDVIEIDPDGDGEMTHYKEEFQDEFNGYYDEEYDRIAELMGFDFCEDDGIRKKE